MFFEEENISVEDFKKHNLFGGFTPHNFDINVTFFDALFAKIYSRWKLHFLIFLSLQIILSNYYPIFFMFLCLDVLIQYCWILSFSEFLTQENHYDYDSYISQLKGGDSRLNIYVFVYYDFLGYVIYGFNEVGKNICSEIYRYKNYLGMHNKINRKIKYNQDKKFNLLKSKNNIKFSKNYLLNYKNKNEIISKRIKNLINLNFCSNKLLNNNNKYLNIYYYFNKDLSYNFKNLKELKKL